MPKTSTKLPFISLLFLISFASVNAVLFTPALPMIAKDFSIPTSIAQQTISWFLIGYALGQLIYSPFANRFGRKPAIYAGIYLEIIASLICILAGYVHGFTLLVLGRFLLALGSGVGLKMTFTLVNDIYPTLRANQTIAYLSTAFSIAPGIAVMIGGVLVSHFNWPSTFYASACYGLFLLVLSFFIPETKSQLDYNALKPKHLIQNYVRQFQNITLLSGSLLMGGVSCFVYVFAASAPFIAIQLFHMSSIDYGIANLLPPLGLITGSLISARLIKRYTALTLVRNGIFLTLASSILMLALHFITHSILLLLFLPMMLAYFGLALVFNNASSIVMQTVSNKADASAVMNFINMGTATAVVLALGWVSLNILSLAAFYTAISLIMIMLSPLLNKKTTHAVEAN